MNILLIHEPIRSSFVDGTYIEDVSDKFVSTYSFGFMGGIDVPIQYELQFLGQKRESENRDKVPDNGAFNDYYPGLFNWSVFQIKIG